MLKTLLVSLLAVVALALPTATVNATTTAGDHPTVDGRTWLYNNGWTLVNVQGHLTTGWFNAGDSTNPNWLLFNNAGRLQLGWQQVAGQWFFLENRTAEYNSVAGVDRGTMRTGAITIDGQNFYLLSPTTTNNGGAMQTGWANNGRLYHARGHQLFGWQRVGNQWFYLDAVTGVRAGNVNRTSANAVVHVTSSHAGMYLFHYGVMQTGWINVGGGNYRFAANNGRLQVNRWLRHGGGWYLIGTDGLMVRGTAGATNGGTHQVAVGTASYPGLYFFAASGRMQTGWFRHGGNDFHANNAGILSTNTWVGNFRVNGATAASSLDPGIEIPPHAMFHSGRFNIGGVNYTFLYNGRSLGSTQAPGQPPGNDMNPVTNTAWCNAFNATNVVATPVGTNGDATTGGVCQLVTTVVTTPDAADSAACTAFASNDPLGGVVRTVDWDAVEEVCTVTSVTTTTNNR